jgi:hypothetical protein
MPIQHRDIPDAERHEPKGISTASEGTTYASDGLGGGSWESVKLAGQATATEGRVARANGAGGVVWTYPHNGWSYQAHGGANQVVNALSEQKLIIDGAGTTSENNYLPRAIRGTGNLWNVLTSNMTPMIEGDAYDVRINLPVISTAAPATELTIKLDIGGLATPSDVIVTEYAEAGKTIPYVMSFYLGVFTVGDFLTNGGQFFIRTDAGSITVAGASILIKRTSGGDW